MTEQPGSRSPAGGSRSGGRHQRTSSGGRGGTLLIALGVAVAVVVAVVAIVLLNRDGDDGGADLAQAGPSGSSAGPCELTIAASPDIAEAVRTAATGPDAGPCQATVNAVEPADLLAGWDEQDRHPDAWIPDSSAWVTRAQEAGLPLSGSGTSIASTPVVLAVNAVAGERLAGDGSPTVDQVLDTRSTESPVRVGLADPSRSVAAAASIIELRAAVGDGPDARAALTWALRSSPTDLPDTPEGLLERVAADPTLAVPASEQAVWAHNQDTSAATVVPIYPDAGGVLLDFPYVTFTAAADPTQVGLLGDLLRGGSGVAELRAAGFRDPEGVAGPALSGSPGVNPDAGPAMPLTRTDRVDQAVEDLHVTNESSRLLAVLDVSGSMQAQVPGTGGASRIDLAKQAAQRGLSLYTPDSEIGLWIFSTDLAMDSDHRELVPVGLLAGATDGATGQDRLAGALAGIQAIPDGGTGLYDTVLAAVRTMRAEYDPNRVNAVLVLSDGMNDDADSITLEQLVATLRSEQDPQQPIPVIAIGMGPESDVEALTQISRATGGSAYVARDPRDVGEIFLDAVGQRTCRPSCSGG